MKAYVPNPNPQDWVYENGFVYARDAYVETPLSADEQAALASLGPKDEDNPDVARPGEWEQF
jgi:hypothetical protein